MTHQDMLDYALGRLEGPAIEQANLEIECDPALGHRCDCLRQSIRLMLDDGPIEPPPDLRRLTLHFVAEHSIVRRRRILDYLPRSVPFRWTDLAVAAGILLAGLITLMPALSRGRSAVNQAGCMFNLRQLGLGFGQYASTHQVYPAVEPEQYAVCVAVKLKEAGCLTNPQVLDCPCTGSREEMFELDQCLEEIKHPAPFSTILRIRCDYAFNVGFRINGRPVPFGVRLISMIPLVADSPGFNEQGEILKGNSPNHRGHGQNVLFQDQSVRWTRNRQIHPQDRDLYLNEDELPSFGNHAQDFSLVPGGMKVH